MSSGELARLPVQPQEEEPKLLRLNLGSGEMPMEGYENLDRKNGQEIYPLDYEENSICEIRASHVLEHFSHRQVGAVLAHWFEKLQPGGILKIAVPDFRWIVEQYLHNEPINLMGFIMGGQVDGDDFHKALFDRESLQKLMAKVGLERIRMWESDHEDCSSLPVSLNLMGYKPSSTGPISGLELGARVRALLSAPRFGPTSHGQHAGAAIWNLGISYKIGQGAYWHHVLNESIYRDFRHYEYIITVDYDSIFTSQDILELVRLMDAYPDVNAIFAMQMKRQEDQVLGSPRNPVYAGHMQADLIAMNRGHFGCTIFRCECFHDLPTPWFQGIPNENGHWGEGKTDPDIYFWDNWTKAGLNVHMAPGVKIGHLQEVIVWPDKTGRPIFQFGADYHDNGIPEEVAI